MVTSAPHRFADRAEATNVAEQDGDLRVTPSQQIGIGGQLSRQLGRKKLLEAHLHCGGCAFVLDPRSSSGHAPRQGLDEHRFERADQLALSRFLTFAPSITIQRTNDFAGLIQ